MSDISLWIERHAGFYPGQDRRSLPGPDALLRRSRPRHRARRGHARGELGLRRGDRIAWLGLNHPDMLGLLFAAARCGLILVPLNWRLAPPEIAFILRDAGAKVLFAQRDLAAALGPETLPEDCRLVLADAADGDAPNLYDLIAAAGEAPGHDGGPDDPLLIVYTSGTTGRPKGAVLTQRALDCNAANAVHMHDMTARDHILTVLPMFHVGGLNIQTTPALKVGATVTLHDRFDPGAFLAAVARRPADPHGAGACHHLGRPRSPAMGRDRPVLPARRHDRLDGGADRPDRGVPRPRRAGDPDLRLHRDGPGRRLPAHPRRLRQRRLAWAAWASTPRCAWSMPSGADVGPGVPGEVLVRGEHVAGGYWNDPAGTAKAFAGGWFRSGDIAEYDAEGRFWFKDRIKNVIVSGGENIYPAEVERVLRELPGIRECQVIGRPDARWGMVPVAAVVADAGLSREAVLAHFDGRLARFKHPRDVVFLDELPKNAMGKVHLDELARMVERGARLG